MPGATPASRISATDSDENAAATDAGSDATTALRSPQPERSFMSLFDSSFCLVPTANVRMSTALFRGIRSGDALAWCDTFATA